MTRNDAVLQMYITLISEQPHLQTSITIEQFSALLINIEFNSYNDFVDLAKPLINNLLITNAAQVVAEQLNLKLIRGII